MDDNKSKSRYRSYLLRCWETHQPGDEPGRRWRFSLEDPHSGKRRNFSSLSSLVAALESELLQSEEEDTHFRGPYS